MLSVLVRTIRHEAAGVLSFELVPVDDHELPPFKAGAHVDLHLAPGLIRSYSLCNLETERHRYVIGVNRDASSRGGSSRMHDVLRVGETLTISLPRNNFSLVEDTPHSVLIAGGIGVTPLLAMARRLHVLGRRWDFHYAARSHSVAAFIDELRVLKSTASEATLNLHFDDRAGHPPDLEGILARVPAGAHLYCCGPLPMLAAFESATAEWPKDQTHVEYFSAREAPAVSGGFVIELARSGLELSVPPGKSILDVLLEAGVDVPYSCTEGVCASCETRVLAGVPDHRDLVLSREEQESNTVMMVCCSGAKSARLVLDR